MTKRTFEGATRAAERSIRATPIDLDLFRNWFPDMPDYVLIDFIYKNYAHRPERARELIPYYSRRRFSFGEVLVTPALFTPRTRERLRARTDGELTGFRDDARKHAAQRARLERAGPPKEPLILRARPDGMDLVEGWHRTIQGLQLWPEGYRQPAWVELPKREDDG
ncbi:MAG: hypothetical protein RIB45_09990 [Marivibrio sp.]|uniref:hypothetical protein n=1 Tax=Marivibrio sp. TaxID=2039719 RepID=UPI0032EDCDBD